jgi:predicted adenylyl cyclase CyaB
MALNIELKIKIHSFDEIIKNLKKIKASFSAELLQKDTYYKVEKGKLKLRIVNGEEELIKYSRIEKSSGRLSKYEVLKLPSGSEKFLNSVLKKEVVVEKNRTLFLYDNTRIHLDKVKKLGLFVELETLVLSGKTEAQKRFNKIINLLNLKTSAHIPESYSDLLKKNIKK